MTYGVLNARAGAVASALKEKGVTGGGIVAVLAEQSAEAITGLLGILQAGAAYLPIDPDYPRERIAYMLADSNTRLLLTASPLHFAKDLDVETVSLLDMSAQRPAGVSVSEPPAGAQRAAYIMYTSGTTGRPKAVVVPHRGVVRLVKGTGYIDFSRCRRLLQSNVIGESRSSCALHLLVGNPLAIGAAAPAIFLRVVASHQPGVIGRFLPRRQIIHHRL